MKNKWRQRNVTLLEHPTNPDNLISIGHSFDGKETIVCDEPKEQYKIALAYIAQGKVYTYE